MACLRFFLRNESASCIENEPAGPEQSLTLQDFTQTALVKKRTYDKGAGSMLRLLLLLVAALLAYLFAIESRWLSKRSKRAKWEHPTGGTRRAVGTSMALLVRSYDRPACLKRLLVSLLQSDMALCVERVLYDDGSTHPHMAGILEAFASAGFRVVRGKNAGCRFSLRPALRALGADAKRLLVCYLDDDMVVARHFVSSFSAIFGRIEEDLALAPEDIVLTGFNCDNCQHESVPPSGEGYTARTTIGGASMVFAHASIPVLIRAWERNLDFGIVDRMYATPRGAVYATVPSLVQHAGEEGLNSTVGRSDTARDFQEEEAAEDWQRRASQA